MARLPQGFIDDLLARVDIVAVIEARVPLKKAGRELQACCPFHDEKTPSFTVSPTKQFYHCFGCGAHGTAISFLMEYDRLDFREAVTDLAAQAGMQMPQEAGGQGPGADLQKPLFEVLAASQRLFQRCLRGSPAAIEYLKGRGVSGAVAQRFGIGFAPPGWNFLGQQIERRAGVAAGMLIEREGGGVHDRFRNRIMFPIHDGRGRVIAFGGRALDDDPAKYLNSPETPLFHKGRALYGLYQVRQALKDLPRVFLVEGYMDVVALNQHGIANTVATLGTATTAEHLQALFRATDEVVFCFDGDPAGRRAAWRALDNALPVMRGTRRVRFAFLPDGEDPDSLVRGRGGVARFDALAQASRPASAVLLEGLTAGLELSSADGRSRLVEKARGYIQKLPPEAFKAELIREIAARSGLPGPDLERLYQSGAASPRPPPRATPTTVKVSAVRRALQLLMDRPALADTVEALEPLRAAPVAGAGLLAEAIEFFREHPHVPLAVLIERWRDRDEAAALQRLAAHPPRGDDDDLKREFSECVARIAATASERERARFDALLAQQQRARLSGSEAEELQTLLRRLRARKA